MKKIAILLIMTVLTLGTWISADSPGTTIRYDGNDTYNGTAQIEVFSGEGRRIIVDLYDPGRLSAPVSKDDILLTTCDSYTTADFIRNFSGESLLTRIGEIKRNGLYIRGIASNRDDKLDFPDEKGTNYIFLIETDGIRIVDFGYIGQSKLTEAQMNALGRVDVALIPFYNFRNGMGIYDPRGFNLIKQINPKIIIPTGLDPETARYATELWPGSYCDTPQMTISKEWLPESTRVIFMGPTARQYGLSCKIPGIKQ